MPAPTYDAAMTERTDLITASRVDLTLILLPAIGWLEVAWTLAANDVPLEVAARVLALPLERRASDMPLASISLTASRQ
jgi:hypothetical protein